MSVVFEVPTVSKILKDSGVSLERPRPSIFYTLFGDKIFFLRKDGHDIEIASVNTEIREVYTEIARICPIFHIIGEKKLSVPEQLMEIEKVLVHDALLFKDGDVRYRITNTKNYEIVPTQGILRSFIQLLILMDKQEHISLIRQNKSYQLTYTDKALLETLEFLNLTNGDN